MSTPLPAALLAELSAFIADRMGLHFPKERWEDLASSIASAAREQGLSDALTHVQRLLSTPLSRAEIETLASHLTVGETYFFREKQGFKALEERILPELIASRRVQDRRLRIWSAGCCTGEEPYSMAMLLDRMIPDLAEWNVTILATDINPRFLEIASAGTFGEWSFRAIPEGIRDRYFSPLPGRRMQINRRIRGMVTFSLLNLAEDAYPSLVNNTNAMDIVMCRNVLMYFTSERAAHAVDNLYRSLVPNGWFLVAPCETSQVLFKDFAMVGFPDAIFYRKLAEPVPSFSVPAAPAPFQQMPQADHPQRDRTFAVVLPAPVTPPTVISPAHSAQALANQGRLAEAGEVCSRSISVDPLNASHRFLRALVQQEMGMLGDAVKSLEQALYLDQDFVMAHFALANLGKRLGRHALSLRHYKGALRLLETVEAGSLLPESDGITAGRLQQVIRSAMAEETPGP
jgi:chemotaxis protein methyltransferase CheR